MSLVACTTPTTKPAPPLAGQLGSEHHVAPPGTGVPDTQPPRPEVVPAAVARLENATRQLCRAGALDHHRVIAAMRALADALELVQPLRKTSLQAIRNDAHRLEHSPEGALVHADLVRIALDHARVIFAYGRPYIRWDFAAYAAAVAAFSDAARAIDPEQPLHQQHLRVRRAFEHALAAVEIAAGVAVHSRPCDAS